MANSKDNPSDEFASGLDAERPKAFIFKAEGDKLVGTVEDFSMGYDPTYRNDSYPIVIVKDEADGELRSVHCFHATMMSGMERADPKIGERIGIVYKGERSPKGDGKPYKDFHVKIDRKAQAREVSFTSLYETGEPAQSEPAQSEPDGEGDGLSF